MGVCPSLICSKNDESEKNEKKLQRFFYMNCETVGISIQIVPIDDSGRGDLFNKIKIIGEKTHRKRLMFKTCALVIVIVVLFSKVGSLSI